MPVATPHPAPGACGPAGGPSPAPLPNPGQQPQHRAAPRDADRPLLAAPLLGGPEQGEVLDWEWAALPHEEDPSVTYPGEDEPGDYADWLDELSAVLAAPVARAAARTPSPASPDPAPASPARQDLPDPGEPPSPQDPPDPGEPPSPQDPPDPGEPPSPQDPPDPGEPPSPQDPPDPQEPPSPHRTRPIPRVSRWAARLMPWRRARNWPRWPTRCGSKTWPAWMMIS